MEKNPSDVAKRTIRQTIKMANKTIEQMKNALRFGRDAMSGEQVQKIEAEIAHCQRVASFGSCALSNLPDDKEEQLRVLIDHLSSIQQIAV